MKDKQNDKGVESDREIFKLVGLGIRYSVFRLNRSFFLIERSTSSIRSGRSLQKTKDRPAHTIKRKSKFFRSNRSFFLLKDRFDLETDQINHGLSFSKIDEIDPITADLF